MFKRYPGHEISFVGNYGRLNSGKSFWYDKILNLSQFDGHSVTMLIFSIRRIKVDRASTFGAFLSARENLNFSYLTMSASRATKT